MSHFHHWVTLHRVRFAEPVSALERVFKAPTGPDCWRFCPSQNLGENDLPTLSSDVWCGFAIHNDRDQAQAMFDAPDQALPFGDEVVESWHALALPVQHRGEVNWRGTLESNAALAPNAEDGGGPLAVMTTAGFNDPANPDELPRIKRFALKVGEAIEFLGQQPGNLRTDVFNGGFDGKGGFTLTLWKSDDAMLKAAYHSGHHRMLMDESRDGSLFDFSSFSRLRILDSKGAWEGDPLAEVA